MTINEASKIELLIKALKVLLARSLAQLRYAKNPIIIESISNSIQRTKYTIHVLREDSSTVGLSKKQIYQLLMAVTALKMELNQSNNEINQLQSDLIEAMKIPEAKEKPSELRYNQFTEALFSAKRNKNSYRVYTQ